MCGPSTRLRLPSDASRLRSLCDPLDVRFMLTMLSRYDGKQDLTDALMGGRLEAATLLTWLADREEEIIRWKNQARIAALPIFPTSSGYRIRGMVRPSRAGSFDRLGIADAIDTTRIAGCEGFLIRLGARRLTRQRYLVDFLPRSAAQPSIVASNAWRELIPGIWLVTLTRWRRTIESELRCGLSARACYPPRGTHDGSRCGRVLRNPGGAGCVRR